MTPSWPADRPVPVRPIPRRAPLGDHAFGFDSYLCARCGMPLTELFEAPGLQRWCTGARDGDWQRRAAEDRPRRDALRAESDRAFEAAQLAADDATPFTWGDIKRAFGIPPGEPLPS